MAKGLRDSDDVVEQMGIERAWGAIESADVVLFLHDLSRQDATEYVAHDAVIAGAIAEKCPASVPVLHVWNKTDVSAVAVPDTGIALSTKTLQGLQALREALLQAAGWQGAQTGTFIARERHLQALRSARSHAEMAADHLQARAAHLDLMLRNCASHTTR